MSKKVKIGIESMSEIFNFLSFLGPPHSIVTDPSDEQLEMENGTSLSLSVQVKDKAGNLTVHPKLNVVCKVTLVFNSAKRHQPFRIISHQEMCHNRGGKNILLSGTTK